MHKFRHEWDVKIVECGDKAKCIKCGLIKESLGFHFGFLYYFEDDDFCFERTTSCGEKITKAILKDAQNIYLKKHKGIL
jgi:hypothetical protein